MAKVPYSPVPSVGATSDAAPNIGVRAVPDAFGASEAEGKRALGNALERAGDEIFQRAMALQDIQNKAEADDADTEYILATGKLHAEYNSLQGKAAVDAFPKYQQDLTRLRDEIGNKLTNSASKRMYDSSSRGLLNRTIFNGAGHAASQNKRWAVGTSEAKVKALGDQAMAMPSDNGAFAASLETVKAEVREQAGLMGWGPEQTEQATTERISDLWSKRIEGMAKGEPFKAKKLLDEATKAGGLRGEQIAKTTNFVQQQLYTVGARNISHDISSGRDLYFGRGKVSLTSARAAVGGFESGGNYMARGPEVFTKDGRSRGRALGKYQVMPENLAPWLKQAGMPSMTEEEFLKNAKAQDQLFDAIFGGYMEKHGSFNEAASLWFSGKTIAEAGGVSDVNKTTVPSYLRNTNAILAQNMPLADRIERGKQLAGEIAPDAPLMEDYVTQRISADFSTDQRVKLNDQYLNRQVVEVGLMGGKDGKLPTTLDELKAMDPKIDQAWANLEPSKQRQYLGILARNAKGDTTWTVDNLREYQKLKGMAIADPAAFADQDIAPMGLPIAARRELLNLQTKLKAKAESDPRVTRALGILGPDLQAAGVTRANNPDTYYQFVGSLQDALNDFQGENQKPPAMKDVQAIGARLLQEQSVSMWSREYNPTGWGSRTMFTIPVPEVEAEKIKSDPMWQQIGIVPTEAQIQRVYTRSLYQRLYGKAPKAADPNQPQVPQSK